MGNILEKEKETYLGPRPILILVAPFFPVFVIPCKIIFQYFDFVIDILSIFNTPNMEYNLWNTVHFNKA